MTNTPGHHQLTFRNILLATDFGRASQHAFHAALQLSAVFGANLHILNVFEYVNDIPPENGGLLMDFSEFHKEAEASLDKLVQEALQSGARATGTMREGLAHASILEYVDNKSIDPCCDWDAGAAWI